MPETQCRYSSVLRGGLSGLGGVVIGFGNGLAGGSPLGGSGVISPHVCQVGRLRARPEERPAIRWRSIGPRLRS
jgi:hypothetical protein